MRRFTRVPAARVQVVLAALPEPEFADEPLDLAVLLAEMLDHRLHGRDGGGPQGQVRVDQALLQAAVDLKLLADVLGQVNPVVEVRGLPVAVIEVLHLAVVLPEQGGCGGMHRSFHDKPP